MSKARPEQKKDDENRPPEERMLKFFAYGHLPEPAKAVSSEFATIAHMLADNIKPGPERTVALRKLLEAKDAAVRATLFPGG